MASTDPRKAARPARGRAQPIHEDVAFDQTDVTPRAVLSFLVYLGAAIVVALLVVWWSLALIESRAARSDRPPSPLRAGMKEPEPPEPRLQGVPGHASDPQQDLRKYLSETQKELNNYGWVDEKTGEQVLPAQLKKREQPAPHGDEHSPALPAHSRSSRRRGRSATAMRPVSAFAATRSSAVVAPRDRR